MKWSFLSFIKMLKVATLKTFIILIIPFAFGRLYNVLKPTSPEETIPLGESSSLTAEYSRKSMSVGLMSSFASALGERAIAFDFAPAVADLNTRRSSRSSDTDAEVAHPVFILRENGDIYYLLHRIFQTRYMFYIFENSKLKSVMSSTDFS